MESSGLELLTMNHPELKPLVTICVRDFGSWLLLNRFVDLGIGLVFFGIIPAIWVQRRSIDSILKSRS